MNMLQPLILKYALQNALKFNGKANENAVLGKVIKEHPEYKGKIPEIKDKLNQIIKEVNSLSLDEQKGKLEEIAPELLIERHEEKKHELPILKNAIKGKVIMRFEPSPSGPLHIGHAYVLSLNSEYCRIYDGKLILRIGDTNPNNIYEPAYNLIPEDANWVTNNNISEVIIQSDRIKKYYEYMEKLLELEKAYICTCEVEHYKGLLLKSRACPCRELSKSEQKKRWRGMLSDFKQGSTVARAKTELFHKNPAIRDYPLFRIIETPHSKQGKKYRVWPLMNMAVAVDDIESKVTHIIRAKDHYDNAIRQKYIFDYLKKPFPESLFVGRINFIDMMVSCSKTRPLIEDGTYSGWDDIRLPFLLALRRRGYEPSAFIKYALDVGVTLHDKTVSKDDFFKSIDAFNKDIIDKTSYRYFFISEPVKIKIENAPEQEVELDLHPDNKKRGRKFKVKENFFIAKADYKNIKERLSSHLSQTGGKTNLEKGRTHRVSVSERACYPSMPGGVGSPFDKKLCRLMDCLNFIKKGKKFIFDSLDYYIFKEKGDLIIHWLPVDEGVKTEVIMPDNSIVTGISENLVSKLKIGAVVQFTRFGFCRLDEIKDDKIIFRFGHR